MSRTVWSLIIVMLLHSFFTCAVVAGHVEDSEHTFDYTYHQHVHNSESADNQDDIGSSHQHTNHAHISCITGYAVNTSDIPVVATAIVHQLLPFESNTKQPPVPPPNA